MSEQIIKKLERIESLLSFNKKILSFSDMLAFTGMSESRLYKLTSSRKIPFSKVGRSLYFDKKLIEEWLMSNPNLTDDEIEETFNKQLLRNKQR
jgi:predicted DNA-binding transcriptional regulator AlpA